MTGDLLPLLPATLFAALERGKGRLSRLPRLPQSFSALSRYPAFGVALKDANMALDRGVLHGGALHCSSCSRSLLGGFP